MSVEFIQTAAQPDRFDAVEWCADASAVGLSVYRVLTARWRVTPHGATHVAVAAPSGNLYRFSMRERRVVGVAIDRVMSIGTHAWC